MISCPYCQIPLDAPDLAGMTVMCVGCKNQFVMPGDVREEFFVSAPVRIRRKTIGGFWPAFLSFVLVGLGQIVNGKYSKGAAMLGFAFFGGFCAWYTFGATFLLSLGIWIWSILDAYDG